MLGKANAQVEIAGGSPALPGFAATGDPQALAIGDAGWNLDLVGFGFGHLAGAATNVANMARALPGATAVLTGDPTPNGHRPNRSAQRLLQGDHNVALDIAAALSEVFLGKTAGSAETASLPAAA